MKKLLFNNTEFQAERIVKTSDSIVGYSGNSEIFAFRGISDFSLFSLGENQEWDINEIEKLRIDQAQANAELVQLIMTMGGA